MASYASGETNRAVLYDYDAAGNRLRERSYGADGESADYDTNRLSDLWELKYFGGLGNDPDVDRDGDGVANWKESRAGTDPTNRASFLGMLGFSNVVSFATDPITVRWRSAPNKFYELYRSTNLTAGFPAALATNLSATPPENRYPDPTATNPGPYFYRIKVE
jgi:hypothetical protein